MERWPSTRRAGVNTQCHSHWKQSTWIITYSWHSQGAQLLHWSSFDGFLISEKTVQVPVVEVVWQRMLKQLIVRYSNPWSAWNLR